MSRKIGEHFEQLACKHLQAHDMKIITTNFTTKGGEIDVIARDQNTLVFIEVKYRRPTTDDRRPTTDDRLIMPRQLKPLPTVKSDAWCMQPKRIYLLTISMTNAPAALTLLLLMTTNCNGLKMPFGFKEA